MQERLSVCLETVFTGENRKYDPQSIDKHIAKIGTLGFKLFEFWDWKDKDIEKIKVEARENGLKVALIAGQRKHTLLDENDWDGFITEVSKSIRVAHQLECERLTIMVDEPNDKWHFTTIYPGLGDFQKYLNVTKCLTKLAEIAEKENVILCLEHFNTICDHPGYWLDSVELGFKIIERVASNNIKLLVDIYHMGVMEGNIVQKISGNLDLIGYFHIASVPSRNEPWLGELNYKNILQEIIASGKYSGCFGLEYYPTMDPEESLKSVTDYLC